MHRQLRELDRIYAGPPPRRRSGDGWRRFVVTSTTTVVAVAATLVLLQHEGVRVSLDGISRRVGPGPATAAEGSGSYKFMAHQDGLPDTPVTYNPCRHVHVVVNADLSPPGGDRILDSALAEVSRDTGLTFVRDGVTHEIPRRGRPTRDFARYGPGRSPVLIAWVTPEQDPGLAGDVAGLGGSDPVRDSLTGRLTYVTGTVSLDSPTLREILLRPAGELEAQAVVMHELGHVVGLDHVADPHELMYADNVGQTQFGPGDLTGLARLGTGPCVG
jgi:hypothetical protein